MPLPNDFMRQVTRQTGEHWGWDGRRAYNRVNGAPQYRGHNAARFAYVETHGELDEGTPYVRAKCGVRDCVNPSHLEPVAEAPGRTKMGVPIMDPEPGRIDAIEERLARLENLVERLAEAYEQHVFSIRKQVDSIELAVGELQERAAIDDDPDAPVMARL